ncbi:plastocyanin/azurin family copper-binding protein [Merismopedia glauca]|uniref:Copper-binding protein n=1 Tax=Merismopedia glauca CCAP 1448/3 TaxID=1296344 RepID=A0A2T1BYU9_9CYAN|nr:plastocyanin/azurin family copper-binding protein [Merismopedia glauca]PSB01191.1 copper-binding protein [Merismopedia glauca CCAP 1448/3]
MRVIFARKLHLFRLNIVLVISIIFFSFYRVIPSALAASETLDLARQIPIEVKVSLGNNNNELKFFPNQFAFFAGKRYKLTLENPSNQKHYFTAKDFADGIWTQKVEAGRVEVKGAIHELELKPGAKAEWVFIPLKAGKYGLRCTVAGHTEAGMTGAIAISPPPNLSLR